MDSRGWIPVSLIASFNRIRALTLDIRLVKEVLLLSDIVEVMDESVRMKGDQWTPFVLPDANPSTVERQPELEGSSANAMNGQAPADAGLEGSAEVEVDGDAESADAEGEEDEDDDVVFVMERTTSEDTWATARRQA